MPTTLKAGLSNFANTIIKNLRHRDYARVCKIAQDYTIYVTGEGIEEKLMRFNSRETPAQFTQRVALTQAITPDITNSTMNPMFKVGRTPASKVMRWAKEQTTQENKKRLLEAGEKYSGDQSVEDYLTYRMPELDSTDPNSFIVTEFEGEYDPNKPDQKIQPYPFEVSAAEAINFEFMNRDLQWLVVMNKIEILDKDGKAHAGEKFTIYLSNETIVAKQMHKDEFVKWRVENAEAIDVADVIKGGLAVDEITMDTKQVYFLVAGNKKDKNERHFIVQYYEHKAGFVPAKRVGIKRDLTTRGRTCVPIIHPAKAYLDKSIKTMSEFDLTNCLHTFPQKIQYTDLCPGEKTKKGNVGCNGGTTPTGQTCTACQGTGYKVHNSSQDLIQIRMPRDIKDLVSLENIMVYKYPPIDLLKFQQEYGFDKLKRAAQGAVYNSDVYSPEQTAVTATEKRIDLEAVYDTLMPFAKNWSEMWVHIYKAIAAFSDLSTDLELSHKFPNDFKMKAFEALLSDLKAANENSAPSHVKKAITNDITRKMYIDNPAEITKIETKDRYFPFPGKSETEINYILANDLTSRYNKILYAHFDLVFSEIEFDHKDSNVDFYQLEETKQREIVKKKVKQIITDIDNEDFAGATAGLDVEGAGNELANSVGGLTGMIEIVKAIASGLYPREAAVALVAQRFGITEEEASRQIGQPPKVTQEQAEKAATLV